MIFLSKANYKLIWVVKKNYWPEVQCGRLEGVGRVLSGVQLFHNNPWQHLEDQGILVFKTIG